MDEAKFFFFKKFSRSLRFLNDLIFLLQGIQCLLTKKCNPLSLTSPSTQRKTSSTLPSGPSIPFLTEPLKSYKKKINSFHITICQLKFDLVRIFMSCYPSLHIQFLYSSVLNIHPVLMHNLVAT